MYPCAGGKSENQMFFYTKAYSEVRREGQFGSRSVRGQWITARVHAGKDEFQGFPLLFSIESGVWTLLATRLGQSPPCMGVTR